MRQPTASQPIERHSVFSDHILRNATQQSGVLCNLPVEVLELILSHLHVGHRIVLGLTCKQVAKVSSLQDVHSGMSTLFLREMEVLLGSHSALYEKYMLTIRFI
jgi:hypothetical protein